MLHAVVLYSVGSPDTLSKDCIKQYLGHFLSDPEVVKIPGFIWQPILNNVILRSRPARMLNRYSQIFVGPNHEQNPYLLTTNNLCTKLEALLNHSSGNAIASHASLSDSSLTSSSLGESSFSHSSLASSSAYNARPHHVNNGSWVSPATSPLPPVPPLASGDSLSKVSSVPPASASCPHVAFGHAAANLLSTANDELALTPSDDSTDSLAHGAFTNGNLANVDLASEYQTPRSVSPTDFTLAKGSPLAAHAPDPTSTLQFMVRPAYAYVEPSLEQVVRECVAAGATKFTLIPLFPQYSHTTSRRPRQEMQALLSKLNQERARAAATAAAAASTTTATSAAATVAASTPALAPLTAAIVPSYATHPLYIQALTNQIKYTFHKAWPGVAPEQMNSWLKEQKVRLLLSFHSLPVSYIKQGDSYQEECNATVAKLKEQLALELKIDAQFIVHSYQSKMGPATWLQPYTEEEVERLAEQGVAHIFALNPGFAVDCLETLYDLKTKASEIFIKNGGSTFMTLPCLNDSADALELYRDLVLTQGEPI